MVKNGLFILSVGFLVLIVGAFGPDMNIASIPLLILSLGLIVIGGIVFYFGNKKYKESKKDEGDANEDR
jgi:uncharacterized membrane protein